VNGTLLLLFPHLSAIHTIARGLGDPGREGGSAARRGQAARAA